MKMNGYQYAYELRKGLYGLGVYTLERIPKGCRVWTFQAKDHENPTAPHNILRYPSLEEVQQRLQKESPEYITFLLDHWYFYNDAVNEILDDSQYTNHSEDPSCVSNPSDGCIYATRDIEPGEELTEDYRTFHTTEWYQMIRNEHNSQWSFL
jgi:SET domain-containing protein